MRPVTNPPSNIETPGVATASAGHAANDDAQLLGAARLAFYTPVIDQPSLADRKAVFLLTMTGLVATTLILFVPQAAAIITGPNRVAGMALAVLSSGLVGMLLGAGRYAYAGFVEPLPAHPAVTFFRHVAARDFQQYVDELRGASLRSAVEAILHYNHAAATQAVNKYRRVNKAQAYMRLAIPIWMAMMMSIALCR